MKKTVFGLLMCIIILLTSCSSSTTSGTSSAASPTESSGDDSSTSNQLDLEPEPEIQLKTVLMKETHYKADDSIRGWVEYHYDDEKNQITSYTYDEQEILTETCVEQYDENGNLLTLLKCDKNDEVILREEHVYDSESKEISRTCYEKSEDGNESDYVITMEYNESGLLQSEIKSEDGIEWKTNYIYDEHDLVIAVKSYYPEIYYNGKIFSEEKFEYDSNGNKYKKTFNIYSEYGNVLFDSEDTYRYDEDNKLIESRADWYGDDYVELLEYDETGNLMKMTAYDGDLLWYRTYEYGFIPVDSSVPSHAHQ